MRPPGRIGRSVTCSGLHASGSQLNQKVLKSPGSADLLSQLAVVDAELAPPD
jgi:hypothetical protein